MTFDNPHRSAASQLPVRGTDECPWLTREQILDSLDEELCLYDKARLQHIPEADAQRAGLCWLAYLISCSHVRRNTSGSFSWPRLEYNPHLPREKGETCHRCERFSLECGHPGWYHLKNVESGYDLALDYWRRMSKRPPVEVPEEPVRQAGEEWTAFRKDETGFTTVTLFPAAIRHFEWSRTYKNRSLLQYLGEFPEAEKIVSWPKNKPEPLNLLTPPENYREGKDGDDGGWNVEFRHEDGSIETFPGVFFPRLNERHKKRKREWMWIWKRLTLWLELDQERNCGNDETRRTRFKRLTGEIMAYLEENGPEPDDDIDLDEAIPENERKAIDQFVDYFVKQTVGNFMKEAFPMKFNFPTRNETDPDQSAPPQ